MAADETTERVDPLLGQILAERYKLTRKIGEGGMGTVYEATHVVLGKSVAVKVLREKYADRPSVAKRLVQEAQLASAIRHENIIDITDSGATDDGRTFVVMELIEGQNLAELLKREGAIPEARALAIALQVAGAVGAAHARGIVHRDVKPENVLLSPRGGRDFVKVVDFGISKTMKPGDVDDVGRLTSTGMVLGTPFYMSPEQARGDEEVDHRIDVYALGVILYECVTGEVPFRGPNYLGILQRVSKDEATPMRQLRPELGVSEAIERVVQKAMAKDREQRYPTMAAMAADLERVLAGKPVEAPDSVRPEPPSAKRVGPWSVAAGIALVAAVAIGVALIQGKSPPPKPAPPPLADKRVEPPPPPPPPANVTLHIESTPPGAEVRDGKKLYGATPLDVIVPRGDETARLTFHLDGYEPAFAAVVPKADDTVAITLSPLPKKKRARPTPPPPSSTKPPPSTPEPPHPETLPNPYGKAKPK